MRFAYELPSAIIRVFICTPIKSLIGVSQAPESFSLSKIKDAAAGREKMAVEFCEHSA